MDDGRLHRSGLRIIDGGLADEVDASTTPGVPVSWARGDSWPELTPIELRRHGRIIAVLLLDPSLHLDDGCRELIERALDC